MQLETYLLENFYSECLVWIFSKNREAIIYGTCDYLCTH